MDSHIVRSGQIVVPYNNVLYQPLFLWNPFRLSASTKILESL